MKRKRTVVLSMVVLGAAVAAGSAGCGRHRAFDPARADQVVSDRIDDLLDSVDATDNQRKQILGIKDRLMPEALSLGTDHARIRKELLAELESASPDRARLHATIDQRADAMRTFAHKAMDGL